MADILSGTALSNAIAADLAARVGALARPPTLVVISVGSRADTIAYIAAKERFAKRIGAMFRKEAFPEDVASSVIEQALAALSGARDVDGIIVQLPLPSHLDRNALIERIPPEKDVDGLSAANIRRLVAGTPRITPATARGVCNLLSGYGISVAGKRIAIVGRSLLVGKGVALALLSKDATVTMCHTKTPDLPSVTKGADILVVAAGSPGPIGARHVAAGQIVIDVGITAVGEPGENGKRTFVGDVDAAAVSPIVAALSPVPGGVGPMTVSALFQNLIEAAERGHRPQKKAEGPGAQSLFVG